MWAFMKSSSDHRRLFGSFSHGWMVTASAALTRRQSLLVRLFIVSAGAGTSFTAALADHRREVTTSDGPVCPVEAVTGRAGRESPKTPGSATPPRRTTR